MSEPITDAGLDRIYEYRAINVARVIDGDTFDLDLDLGFYAGRGRVAPA